MKNKKNVILLVAIFVFVFGMAYADVDNPQIFVPVQATVMVPSVTVTLNADGLNFGQILPHVSDDRFVAINVHGVAPNANPAGAQTAADGATVDDTNDTMASPLADPTEVLLPGTTRTAGGFALVSDIAASVTIVFADTLILTSDVVPTFGAAATMDVTEIHANSNHDGLVGSPIALVAGAPQYFHIGGVLNVGGAQGSGTYTNVDGGLQVDIALQ